MEHGQMRELHNIGKAGNVPGEIKDGSVVSDATVATVDDDLNKHLKIAGLDLNKLN